MHVLRARPHDERLAPGSPKIGQRHPYALVDSSQVDAAVDLVLVVEPIAPNVTRALSLRAKQHDVYVCESVQSYNKKNLHRSHSTLPRQNHA